MGGVVVAVLALPAMAQTPRYQSPYGGQQPAQQAAPTLPALPTPAPITPNGTVVEDVIARVNDQIINRSDVERSQAQLQQEIQQQNLVGTEREQRERDMLRDMVDQQLLLSKAKELGLNGDAEVIRQLDEIRKQNKLDSMEDLEKAARQQGVNFEDFKANIRNRVLTQQVVRDEVGRRLQQPTKAAEQTFYDAHKQDFEQPEQVRLSEILIPTAADATDAQVTQAQAKAESVETKVKAGDDFTALAKQFSGGQTASAGGDLGLFKRGALAKVLEDQTFSLKAGQTTAPIRTRQGFVILKVTDKQEAGVPPLKAIEPQIQEGMYMQQMQPALRAYLTRLREESYVDIKPGYVDSGASPKQTKPVFTAYSAPVPKKKKAEQKARFDRSHGGSATPPTVARGLAPLAPGVAPSTVDRKVSGATPLPGTTTAVAAAATAEAPASSSVAAADNPAGQTSSVPAAKSRMVSSRSGKQKKIRREKIRFGQAPRNSLPAGPEEVATRGADTGSGAQSAAVTPGGTMENLGKPSQGGDVAPGVAMAPTEGTTQISSTSDPDPLAPHAAVSGKVRFAARDKEFRAQKEATKQAKVQEKKAQTPVGPDIQEAASHNTQAAPLGLNGDTVKKQKVKREKGATKERLQDKKPVAPEAAPIAPTVNPNLGTTPAGSAAGTNPAPDSNDRNTTLPPVTTPPAGAPPQGQPLAPTGSPETTPNGTRAPQPQR